MRIFSIFLLSMCLSGCSYLPLGNKKAPIYPPQSNNVYYGPVVYVDNNAGVEKRENINIFTKEEGETEFQELQEQEKKSPQLISSQPRTDKEYVEKRKTPYQKDGKWVYPNVDNGKPVSTSYKLQLD